MINLNKEYPELSHDERVEVWGIYKNACQLCVSLEARKDSKLNQERQHRADKLYNRFIRHFTAADIV